MSLLPAPSTATPSSPRAPRAGRLGRLIDLSSAPVAAGWYLGLTVALTWPLALGLARDIPADLGDSLLNCWILGWGLQHVIPVLEGHLPAWAAYWNANIFYPEPLALAYSEHLFAQVLQALPVYALTGNLVLCYNLLFLSTFALSGLGTYLLVRDLTGNPRAAFVAGLFYAFVPYRVAQFSHVQVLSAQWMPFVLVGLRRHFESRRLAPLAWAALALVAQNLSNGYFLIYFTPLVCLFVVFEMWRRDRLADLRQWAAVVVAAGAVAAATWPFLAPYLRLRALGAPPRSLDEVQAFSANVFSYLTASPAVRLGGRWFAAFMQPEGELFPGTVPILLAALAVTVQIRAWTAGWLAALPGLPRWRRTLAWGAAAVAAAHVVAAADILLTGGLNVALGPLALRVTSLNRTVLLAAVAFVALRLATGRPRRSGAARPARVDGGAPGATGATEREHGTRPDAATAWFFVAAGLGTFWLSLGPLARTLWHRLDWGPYLLLFRDVPGFDALRVPARFGMLAILCLSVVAGIGASWVDRRWRLGRAALAVLALAFLVEGAAAPIEMNQTGSAGDLGPLPARVFTGADVPPVYGFLAHLPASAVVLELPFGETNYEVRYMFYSTSHWRPLVNGFSGGFPPSYLERIQALRRPLAEPDEAWRAVAKSGATHVVVHDRYFRAADAVEVGAWLERHGAVNVASFGGDRVFAIR